MTELIAASERYAGWLKIGKEPDGTPSRTDVEREFAGGRIPIRFTGASTVWTSPKKQWIR
jgi:hypothetical protein